MTSYSDLIHQRFESLDEASKADIRKFGFLVFIVALFHGAVITFFSVDISFYKTSPLPDLEIELASEIQTVGNSDTTILAQKRPQKKEKSKNNKSQPVLTQRSSGEDAEKVKRNNSPSSDQSSSTNGAAEATQLAGGVPSANDTHGPKLLNNVKPKYPLDAYKKRVEGTVILYAQVTETGSVGQVKIGVSSGEEALDNSAVEAVKEWKFSPGKTSGKIVAQWIKVPITFNLKK